MVKINGKQFCGRNDVSQLMTQQEYDFLDLLLALSSPHMASLSRLPKMV